MEVVLVRYTPQSEEVCASAMRGCRTNEAVFELKLDPETVKRLIRTAKKMGHLSTLEHASFTFSVKGISRSCTHQLVRHRIASYSQQSQRYVKIKTDNYDWYVIPEMDEDNKTEFEELMGVIANFYQRLLSSGVPAEDARFVLPNATKTNIVITMNARELLHFFSLRLASDAQWEIREMARKMCEEVKKVAPTIFEEYLEGI